MLVLAPYEAPEKKAKKKATGTRKGLRRRVILDSSSESTEAHSSHENEEEEEESSPPAGGDKKRKSKGPRREGLSFRTAPRQPLLALSGSAARRSNNHTPDGDAGSGALQGGCRKVQESGRGDQERSPAQGCIGLIVR